MKKPLYKLTYRAVSWLNDCFGGSFRVLMRWKVALAAIILGFTTTTFVSCEPTCYEPADIPPSESTDSQEGYPDSRSGSGTDASFQ